MAELIYSVQQIFDDKSQSGCLSQYNVTKYHIPAYQRGYKWGSGKNGAVQILLTDLYGAFKQAPDKEYYLQYITVKSSASEKHLEVIDGQQRLTTLSIFLAVASTILEKENHCDEKLDYAVRSDFFKQYIYNKDELLKLLGFNNWEEFIASDEVNDNQDVYHIFEAAKKIDSYFRLTVKKEKQAFYEYVLNKVKVIVNSVESNVESETVFKNLNSNKVPLTETEIIKGLLITKVGRSQQGSGGQRFVEIMELRSRLGHQWDEITTWANDKKIASFFFNRKSDAMYELLMLVALTMDNGNSIGSKNNPKDFLLFNFYLKRTDFLDVFNRLVYVYRLLKDWYDDDEMYHHFGFVRFVKNSGNNNLSFLKKLINKKTKKEVLEELNNYRLKLIGEGIGNYRYDEEEDKDKIHAVLLSLSVYQVSQTSRFDFYAFIDEKWSLEHIFPQSPEGNNSVLNVVQKEEIYQMLNGKENLNEDIVEILEKESRTDEEKSRYYELLAKEDYLNSLGNMCLLTNRDNSSNGCGFFKEKRSNILGRIQKGSFVPKHTFDVFSKMIKGIEHHSIDTWTRKDIDEHLKTIKSNFLKNDN